MRVYLQFVATLLLLSVNSPVFAAYTREYHNDANSSDEVSETIAPNHQSIIEESRTPKPFSRHMNEITNESELYTVYIDPFLIVASPMVDSDVASVRQAMLQSLGANLNSYVPEMIGFSIGGIKIKPSPDQRLRKLAYTGPAGKTEIEIESGTATFFGARIEKMPDDDFNDAIHEIIQEHLSNHDPFKGTKIEVLTDMPTTDTPSTDTPTLSPTINNVSKFTDTTIVVKDTAAKNKTAPITIGALAVIAVVAGAAFYVQKRYGLFSSRSYSRPDGMEISSTSSRSLKRDLDFEEFVVECCTDNDVFV